MPYSIFEVQFSGQRLARAQLEQGRKNILKYNGFGGSIVKFSLLIMGAKRLFSRYFNEIIFFHRSILMFRMFNIKKKKIEFGERELR